MLKYWSIIIEKTGQYNIIIIAMKKGDYYGKNSK